MHRSSATFSVVSLFMTALIFEFSTSNAQNAYNESSELSSALQNLGRPSLNNFPNPHILNSSTASCALACTILKYVLGDLVSGPGNLSYHGQESLYWSSQQAEVLPACYVQPSSAKDVAAILLVTVFSDCPFAVKSGGHAAFAGASNIQDGVTIDLGNLRDVQVSSDRTLTQVGAGNHWFDVYNDLTPMGLTVIGGRVAAIGVGGLTLGGGISFFSGNHGWACDNVVLANAQIVNVNVDSYPDLYWALRGGGNNFGIVTRFDLETFEQGNMWGGMAFYPISANTSILAAFETFANNAPKDPDATLINAFAYADGQFIVGNDYEYAKPVVNPPIFHELMAIESFQSTLRITNLTDLVLELNTSNPSGFRETYWTSTFKTSAVLQSSILELFVMEVEGIKDAVGIIPALIFEPITKNVISYFNKNGGNALGIEDSDGPLTLMNIAIMWSSMDDDARILAAAKLITDGSITTAKGMGLDFRFLYQNYAAEGQDVFDGYGRDNKNRLINISKKYDPSGVFQRLEPGYFKLNRTEN